MSKISKLKNLDLKTKFGFALAGLVQTFKTELSFRIQTTMLILFSISLFYLKPSGVWLAIFVVMVTLVFAAELFNTALEKLCDRLHPQIHPLIGAAKDASAAAVFIICIAAVAVFCIFLMSK